MSRTKISEALAAGRILVSDGAWGTFLMRKGLKPGECPELWCLSRRDDVLEIARSYVEAGADMVETNSFGASSFKLESHGLGSRAAEINEAAARISREAAGDSRWVIASAGPTGKMLLTGDVEPEQIYEAYKEQAIAFERGGADAVCLETMIDVDEATLAIKAVRENTSLEAICTFTFERNLKGEFRTMMGIAPKDAADAAARAGASIVGTNCGNGMERMIPIVSEIRAALPKTPILVHANAGLPVNVNGCDCFPDTPKAMADLTQALVKAGANVIGGCCGTTPEHIKAIKKAVLALK